MSYPNPPANPDPPSAPQPPYQSPPAYQPPPPYQNPPQYPQQYAPQQPSPYPPQPGAMPPPGPAYGQPPQGYPPQGYPQPPYAQPPYPYPYQQAQPGYAPANPVPQVRNPYAQSALLYGGLSLGANIVGLFLNFYLTGILGVYALYVGIRGLAAAARLPGNKGLWLAIAGTIMAVLSLLISVLGYMSRVGP